MIKQTIKFNSPNQYFGGFLQNIIDTSDINASVSVDENITLFIDETDKNLESFDENIQKYLPHSLFLDEIETTQVEGSITPSNFQSPQYNIAPCNKCLELINDPSSPSYLDESLKCDHYNNPTEKTYEDFTTFSPHYSEGTTVLITNPIKAQELFIVTQDELKALYSIEKPTLKVTILDKTLKEMAGKNYINIKAPYNNRSVLAALNAKESEVDYLFFKDMEDLKIVVVQKNITIIKASRVATPLIELNENKVVNRFLNIAKEANFDKGVIGANLSTKKISFLVSNELGSKEVITLQDYKLEKHLLSFQNHPTRKKLYANFEETFPQIAQKLSDNLDLGLFETIAVILELDEKSYQDGQAFETVGNKGYEFRGNGGLKIDTNYIDNGFDYDAFLGSIISFKLAGAESHYIAYSIFEAFGDMAISTLSQLKQKFKIDKIIMMGDMFSNSVLYSRILSKFQLSNPYFSKAIALDD